MHLKIEHIHTDRDNVEIRYCTSKISLRLTLWGYETRYSWGHKGTISIVSHHGSITPKDTYVESKIVYYNRTWEDYRFQSLIRKLMFKALGEKEAKYYFALLDKAIKKSGRL